MNPLTPCFHGTAQFQLGGSSTELTGENAFITFDFLLLCPNCEESPPNLVKNGHDTSIKDHPQRYRCKTCGTSCMVHTSAFWQAKRDELLALVITTRYSESRSYASLCREYQLSTGQLARFIEAFWQTVVEESLALEILENQWFGVLRHKCESIRAVWIDETFIKIQGRTWYLLVAVDTNGRVIHQRLVDTRENDSLEVFWNELTLKCPHLQLIVTDGLVGYESMYKKQKKRMYHIQHLHKDDYRQIRITQYDYDKKRCKHLMKQVGMSNNDLLTSESKRVYYLEKEGRDRHSRRKVGRPKGSKDTTKRKRPGEKPKGPHSTAEALKRQPTKRRQQTVLRDGQPYLLDPLMATIGLGVAALEQETTKYQKQNEESVFQVFSLIMIAAQVFPRIHMTSNRIESCFSKFDAWQEIRGRRTIKTVDRDVTLFLNYNIWQNNLRELVKKIPYRMSTYPVIKNFPSACKLKLIKETSP